MLYHVCCSMLIISVFASPFEMPCLHSPFAQDHPLLIFQSDEAKAGGFSNHGFQGAGNQVRSKPTIVPGVPHLINERLPTVGHFKIQLRLQGMHGVVAPTDAQALQLQHIFRPAPVDLIPMFHHTSNQGVPRAARAEGRLAGILILLVAHQFGDLKLGSVGLRDVLTCTESKIPPRKSSVSKGVDNGN